MSRFLLVELTREVDDDWARRDRAFTAVKQASPDVDTVTDLAIVSQRLLDQILLPEQLTLEGQRRQVPRKNHRYG